MQQGLRDTLFNIYQPQATAMAADTTVISGGREGGDFAAAVLDTLAGAS